MGMFDTLHYKCPKCGAQNEEQTKSGDCLLKDYSMSNIPDEAIDGLGDRDGKIWCIECSTPFRFGRIPTIVYEHVLVEVMDKE